MLEVCWCFQRLRWPLVLALLAMKVDYRAWTYKKQIFILLLATNHSTISRELQSMVILFTNLKQKTTQIHGLPTDKEKDNSKAIKFHPVKNKALITYGWLFCHTITNMRRFHAWITFFLYWKRLILPKT